MSQIEFETALMKEACPICGKLQDGPIIMNSTLTKKHADNVKKLHGKVYGLMDHPCDECKKNMKLGFLLVGVDESLTTDMSNPYRTGNIWVIRKDAACKIGMDTSKGASFIDIKTAKEIGLPIE